MFPSLYDTLTAGGFLPLAPVVFLIICWFLTKIGG